MSKVPALALSFLLIFMIAPQGFAAPQVETYDGLLQAIREVQSSAQVRIEAAVEAEKVREAWETGKLIDEHILLNQKRAQYGERVLQRLSFDLGKSKRELHYMVEFSHAYPIVPHAAQLSWSDYRDLLAVKEVKERTRLSEQAVREKWDRNTLRREIKRLRLATAEDLVLELPEIAPGPLYTYQIIRLKDRLKIDLGFGLYQDLSEKDAKKFKEGDMVQLKGNKLSAFSPQPSALADSGKLTAESMLYTYSATVTQVVDGDTFHALIDLGFGLTLAQRVRLRRIDAPEILTADGKEAKAYLEKILSRDKGRILLQSHDLDQHGRPIADVWVKDKPIDQELLDQGLAIQIGE